MASFVYNAFTNESYTSQWQRYLQQREYYSDLGSAIQSQTKSFQQEFKNAASIVESSIQDAAIRQVSAVDRSAREQAEAITNAAEIIVGTLDEGFSDLSSKLSDINFSVEQVGDKIEQIGVMLDWRLSELIEQQRISNLLLGNVAQLLRIPDVQKERQYYVEQGFRHYENTRIDQDLYQDALENLLKAEALEKADYIVLRQIGMIYLYGSKVADLPKAEAYLRKAAKYAIVESHPNAEPLLNLLAGDVNGELSGRQDIKKTATAFAAKSYFQAGVACYLQCDFRGAIELSEKAISLLPTLLEAGFLTAKAYSASGNDDHAVGALETVIRAERFYAVKTAADPDLVSRSKVQNLLSRLRDSAVREATERIAKCKPQVEANSRAAAFLLKLEDLVNKNTYLDALGALDGITGQRTWNPSSFQIKLTREVNEELSRLGRWIHLPGLMDESKWKSLQLLNCFLETHTRTFEDFIEYEKQLAKLEANYQETLAEEKRAESLKNDELIKARAQRKQQEDETQRDRVEQLLIQAHRECEKQEKRWFGADYTEALQLFSEAARLGSPDAQYWANKLRQEIKLKKGII